MKTTRQLLVQSFGWYGVIAILAGYFLVSFGWLDAMSLWFQLLNLTGAIGIVVVSYAKRNYQPTVLNLIWAIIALVALFKIRIG